MTLEILQKAKISAMKTGDNIRKNVISGMIDSIQKASITPKGRVEITEKLTDETLIKYQKSIQEQVDTCPAERVELKTQYENELAIVKEYAPQLMTDKKEIMSYILMELSALSIPLEKKQRGAIMKILSKTLKGKADMKIVSEVLGEMLA